MDLLQSLREKITQEKDSKQRAILFWYDASEQMDFTELEQEFAPEEIEVRRITQNNFFRLKYDIEIKHPQTSFVLYASFPRPHDEKNYLLDILLYGAEFKSDEVAMVVAELQVDDQEIRPLVERYAAFFKGKERKHKLKRMLPAHSDQKTVEIAMLAVLSGSPSMTIPDLTKQLLHLGLDSAYNEGLKKVAKFFSLKRMWELILPHFGIVIEGDSSPLLELMESLIYQHFASAARIDPPLMESLKSILPNTCALFIDDWFREEKQKVEQLEGYIRDFESKFRIPEQLRAKSLEGYDLTTTFPSIEGLLIEQMIEQIMHQTADLSAWSERINYHRQSHWGKKEKLAGYYNVLSDVVKLTELKTLLKKYASNSASWGNFLSLYASEWYKIDQAYRHLMQNYWHLEQRELLHPLIEQLTNWYENVYLLHLANQTNDWLSEGTIEHKGKILKQERFYTEQIRPIINKEQTKIFVIISDALRYEVGQDLREQLNQRINGEATIQPMQVSLPSYTQLGMACLLPHREMRIDEGGTVYVDGKSTRGLANREMVLQAHCPESVSYRLGDFMDWSTSVADEKFKRKRLVYLYHDVIDATGDTTKTERETYDAVERTIVVLKDAVDKLSRLQAKRIFITSDHGFLFQYNKVEADAKVKAVTGEIYDKNRRFALGKGLTVPEGAIRLPVEAVSLNCEAVIAKGLNRFIGAGGLQFIHGGAMPQEVVIPLIDYRRTADAELVNVNLATPDKIITNYRQQVTFYQEQRITSDVLPRQVKMAFYKDDERISNEVIYTFDLTGEAMERNVSVVFTLAESHYALGETCHLRIETMRAGKVELYRDEVFTLRMYQTLY
ncbi:BREX-1 system phosphatase PglZ type A [Desulfosporosinus metallidurans]|uniref:Putative cytoplasmic protein n=1 Tax=Desulfosporosinus metallidurans TaxID=1888891 RepID=A0A1Q8QSP1_9FIRM|nr:BREX-1 system phosphatase PglZ type A [Desulfosporosinus metallidurans]OLN30347.1 putative cytoplasmic protein [Desulfosporosinus metallidurans]